MWDLDIFLFQPQPTQADMRWPGLWTGRAPKKTTRSRRRDALWVYLHLQGPQVVSPRTLENLTQKAAETYFATSGAVTSALRRAAETLHRRILQANQHLSRRGESLQGHLFMAVWRSDTLFLAWSGPWHVVVEGKTRRHWHDPEQSGPGLGVGESMPLKFAQAPFHLPLALLAADDLADWQEEDGHRVLQEPETALRAWLQRSPRPRRGLLAVWEPGAYEVRKKFLPLLLPQKAAPPPEAPQPTPPKPDRTAIPGPPSPAPAPVRPPTPRPRPSPSPARRQPERPTPKTHTRRPGRPRLADKAAALLARALAWAPPARPLMLLSLALPLLVLGLMLTLYLREGRYLRHRQWLALAYQQAREATALSDPYEKGPAMEKALDTLERAESFAHTPESETLRREILQWLQRWEGIRWLDARPVLAGEPPAQARLERLIPGNRGFFALDVQNDLVRFFFHHGNEHAFTYEPDFRCAGSQNYGSLRMGRLVDIVTVTGRPLDFDVAAFDAQGRWMTCSLDEPPRAHLLPMPTTQWGEIFQARVLEEDVYLLDRGQNNVFVVNLRQPRAAVPRVLFPPEQGPDFSHVVDFGVLRGELYLLFVDGQIQRCAFHLTETGTPQCQALLYQDARPEREDRTFPVFPNTEFRRLFVYTGPEPGLLLLDARTGAVYRFTLKLRFVTQYRPRSPWPDEVTAFTVSDLFAGTPFLYVVSGGQIYGAPLP